MNTFTGNIFKSISRSSIPTLDKNLKTTGFHSPNDFVFNEN